jgi:ankyrin repeat protein
MVGKRRSFKVRSTFMKSVKPRPNIREGIEASRKGDISGLKAWLRESNNPNAHDPSGWTPLLWAAVRGHHEAVALLLDNEFVKADVTLPHRESSALAIHMAGHSGNVRTAEIILDHRPDHLNAVWDLNGHTVLLQAVFYGHLDLARILLQRGADTSMTTARGAMAQIVKS